MIDLKKTSGLKTKILLALLGCLAVGLFAVDIKLQDAIKKQTPEVLIGAPSESFERNFYPQADNTYTLGSSTLRWNGQFYGVTTTNLTVSGICTGCGGGGSGSVGTSTSGYIAVYDNQNSVTGTPYATFNSSTITLAFSATTTMRTTTIASSSPTGLGVFQVGSALWVDNTPGNSCVAVNRQSCGTYNDHKYGLDVSSYDTYGVLRLSASQPLFKLSGSYNGGNGAEIYQDSSGIFRMNVNSSIVGFAFFTDGSMQAAIRSASRLAVGGVIPSSGVGKLYIRADGSSATSYLIYGENSSGSGPILAVTEAGDIRASGTLRIATGGSLDATFSRFLVDNFGNLTISSTAFASSSVLLNSLSLGSLTSTPAFSSTTTTIRNGLMGVKAGCIANVDRGRTSTTYCTTQAGSLTCSTSSCE